MNATSVILGNRLQTLMGDIHFRYENHDFDSPENLMAIGEHNLREYGKIEAMGEEHKERIENLFANILASALQEEAIARYGNTEDSSIRQVLYGWFNRPEDREFDDKLRQTAKLALLGFNLTEEQCTAVLVDFYDKLPDMLIEFIEEITAPIYMLPRNEAQPIAMALADMMKEEMQC